MLGLNELVRFNEYWEQKEVYRALDAARKASALKRLEDERTKMREEMREHVADIKQRNATEYRVRLHKEEMDKILLANLLLE